MLCSLKENPLPPILRHLRSTKKFLAGPTRAQPDPPAKEK